MRYDRDGQGRREPPPRRRSLVRKLGILATIAVLGAGGYLVYSYHREEGGLIGMDAGKTKRFLARKFGGARDGLGKAGDYMARAGKETLQDARGLYSDLRSWLSDRDVRPASREELSGRSEELTRELESPVDTGPGEPSPPQEPVGTSGTEPSGTETSGTKTSVTDAAGGEPVARATAESPVLAGARSAFAAGLKEWRRAEPGAEGEGRHLARARAHLEEARDLLERAISESPGDARIEKLAVECNLYLYDCLKRTTIDPNG